MIRLFPLHRLAMTVFAAAFSVSCLCAQAPTGPQSGGAPQTTPPPGQAPPAQKPEQGGLSIAVEVPVVSLDVVATTNHGDMITGLKRENFRLFEDGSPQTITNFGPTEAPITMVIVMEFSARHLRDFNLLSSPRFCASPSSRLACDGWCTPDHNTNAPTVVSAFSYALCSSLKAYVLLVLI